jgi:hypothetical protein
MAQLATAAFLFGAVLGIRFRVTGLLPVTFIIGLITLAVVLAGQLTPLEGGTRLGLAALALQAGYLLGSLGMSALEAARASREFARPPQGFNRTSDVLIETEQRFDSLD